MGKVVGIDLGTTNSVVAVLEGGKPVVVANAEGVRTTPSFVAFSKEGEKLVGQMARRQAVLNPQNTFYGVKRFIGRKYNELNSASKKVPYTLRKDEATGNVRLRCPRMDKDFAPEEISAMILRKLADEASRYLGQSVTGAVITVPAYFNDAQRQATRDAGRIAGLEVKRILNEPTAAALAYGLDQQYNQTILVFDLGGGTFDVSILDVRNNVFEVKATSGDTQLGGTNFDKKIVDWLADEFLDREGVDLRRDRQALQRLTEAAEKAKIELSGLPSAEINLPFITATADGPKHIETKLSRSHFESFCADLVGGLRGPLQQAMRDANLSPSQIDEVVLVGGSSRMPMVQALVRSVLSKEPSQNVNPDEAVAVGAAVQAGILTQEVQDIMLLDVTPLSLGLETIGGVMKRVIPRNTTIPVRRSDAFSTSENNQTVVEVHILQGEREMAQDNKSLGRFKLMGIPPAPRGIPQVQVSFDIDANGILQVSALDKTTGREQSITVQEASTLSEDEIQIMIRDAEEYADTDRALRERIEKRNRAETLTFTAERALREVALDFGLQFARDRRRRIEGLIQDLRDALKREDERVIDLAQSELQDEVYELNREAYLYDTEDRDGNFLGQVGNTLKRVFSDDDDDYYRRGGYDYGSAYGNAWDQQARWDSPNWGAAGRAQGNWDDWDDDWDAAARRDADDRYRRDQQGYDQRGYDQQGYDQQRQNYPSRYDQQRQAYDQQGYDQRGYDQRGYDQRGYDPSYEQGYDRDYERGYDAGRQGYDQRGYESGRNRDGAAGRDYGDSGYGDSGYGDSGYGDSGSNYANSRPDDRRTRSDRGYDRQDYDRQDYNSQGYDSQSYDSQGYDSQGYRTFGPSDRPSRYDQQAYRDLPQGSRSDDPGGTGGASGSEDRGYPSRRDERRDYASGSTRDAAPRDSWEPPDPWAADGADRAEASRRPERDRPDRERPRRDYSGNSDLPPVSQDAPRPDLPPSDRRDDWSDENEFW